MHPRSTSPALSLGYTVTREAPGGPCGCEGLHVPNELFVQRARPLMFALRVLHEKPPTRLHLRSSTTYTHGDVWVLTIFLAIPLRRCPTSSWSSVSRSGRIRSAAPGGRHRPRVMTGGINFVRATG
ncbi:MAG: hypothetical protein U0325_31395 [Polyangiales bacterium]